MAKWARPERQAHLVQLFLRSRGFCVLGHPKCQVPEHHYQLFIEDLIADWITDDRARRQADWQAERKLMHGLGERSYPLRGEFSAIGKDVFFDRQPEYYLEGIGVSGLTFKPFAKVRLASSILRLHVDLTDTMKGVSKNQRRKALRYGKLTNTTERQVRLAVEHYLNH